MTVTAISPAQTIIAASSQTANASSAPMRNGLSRVETVAADGHPLTFAVGSAGERMAGVRVVIKDDLGLTVATFALSALSGTQAVIWTPKPGTSAGGYAAYWEGDALATTST